jgi:hypothetical protein
MRLPEDGPICGLNDVATVKQSQREQFDWFIFIHCCVDGQIPLKAKRSLPILVAMLHMFTFSERSNMKIAESNPVRGRDVHTRPSTRTTALLHCGCYSS